MGSAPGPSLPSSAPSVPRSPPAFSRGDGSPTWHEAPRFGGAPGEATWCLHALSAPGPRSGSTPRPTRVTPAPKGSPRPPGQAPTGASPDPSLWDTPRAPTGGSKPRVDIKPMASTSPTQPQGVSALCPPHGRQRAPSLPPHQVQKLRPWQQPGRWWHRFLGDPSCITTFTPLGVCI